MPIYRYTIAHSIEFFQYFFDIMQIIFEIQNYIELNTRYVKILCTSGKFIIRVALGKG